MTGPGEVKNRTQVQVPLDIAENIYVQEERPNVYNTGVAILRASTPLSVDKFFGGIKNQYLRVKAEGSVTLIHGASGEGGIETNTGLNKVLNPSKVYTFTYIDNERWVESADENTTPPTPTPFPLSPGNYIDGLSFDGSIARTWNIEGESTNTPNVLVARDASGDFSAGTITADLTGIATDALNVPWAGVSGTPTTIAGYGITDFVSLGDAQWVQLSGSYADPSWITSLAYSKITGVPPSRSESDSMLLMGG